MLASAMIQRIKDIGYDNLTDQQILDYINEAYHEFCGREPWPFLEQESNLTVDGAGKITAPVILAVQTIVDTTNGYHLSPAKREDIVKAYPRVTTQTGPARFYMTIGDSFYLYPIPSGIVYKFLGLVDPADLTAGAAPIFNAKHHEILVYLALERAAIGEDDTALAADYRNTGERLIANARNDLWKKQFDSPDYMESTDWYDYSDWDIY